jgi:hypothetical protein
VTNEVPLSAMAVNPKVTTAATLPRTCRTSGFSGRRVEQTASAGVTSCPLRPRSSADEQLTQDVRQDPTVSKVGGLGWGVDPDRRSELTGLPVLVHPYRHLAGQLCAIY